MLELLTLYKIADYLCDPKYSRNGEPINIETNKDPEYSEDIRELIQECVRVSYRHRPNLDVLQTRINAHLAQIQNAYEQADDEGKAKFRSDSRLYYVGSQINDMETGNWAPDDPKKKPKRERWPEGPPIIYPKFDDGPESGEEDDDSDEDDSDDDEDGDGNPFKARRTVQQPQGKIFPIPQPPPNFLSSTTIPS